MIPVFMTRFYNEKKKKQGNHLACCIASILHLSLKNVPAFENMGRDNTGPALEEFMIKHNLAIVLGDGKPHKDRWCIAIGKISSGVTHSAVYFGNRLVHNPHPQNLPFNSISEFIAFSPLTKKQRELLEQAISDSAQGGSEETGNQKGTSMKPDDTNAAPDAANTESEAANDTKTEGEAAGTDDTAGTADGDAGTDQSQDEKSEAAAEGDGGKEAA